MQGYSQYMQDQFIDFVLLNRKKRGVFIDIGAHDGVTHSNSFYFERHHAWSGICIEPNPVVFERLVANRTCNCENVCISDTEKMVAFTSISGYSEMLSGISDSYDERHKERISQELKLKGGAVKEIEVPALPIASLIMKYNLKEVQFCSIDTEGNEWPILCSFPFEILKPQIFLVENNYRDKRFRELLEEQGYSFVIRLGDEIYLNRRLTAKDQMKIFLFRLLRKIGYFKKS